MSEQNLWKTAPELWEKLKPLVREMRINPTPAENLLWQRLRKRLLHGCKFRRQHPFERFIVDFYCPAVRLIIEVDGSIHEGREVEDAIRQAFLESLGLKVMRFTNENVFENINGVVEVIAAEVVGKCGDGE